MTGIIDDIKYGLVMFYQLKYKKESCDFVEIPKVVDSIFSIELWLINLREKPIIDNDIHFEIEKLLKQYYRTEFLIFFDSRSIKEYQESKVYFPYDALIEYEFAFKKNKNTYYANWIEGENRKIERFKSFNRYSDYTEIEFIKDISFESFNNKKVYSFLKEYFISRLDNIFSQLHLEFKLGDISIISNKDIIPITSVSKVVYQVNSVLKIETNQLVAKSKEQENKAEKYVRLSELITHELGKKIINEIKIRYKNIKGKRLKLLLLALQELDLLPKERIAFKFHACCESEFNWDVASYNALNGYEYNESLDKEEMGAMISFINDTISNNK
jgi:hypothetical protein